MGIIIKDKINKNMYDWLYSDEFEYRECDWDRFSYKDLKDKVSYKKPTKCKGHKKLYAPNIICVFDTETSRTHGLEQDENGKYIANDNYIICWTLSLHSYFPAQEQVYDNETKKQSRVPVNLNKPIATLKGRTPEDFCKCIKRLRHFMPTDCMLRLYAWNLGYDYTFLQYFLINEFGKPTKEFYLSSHKPLYVEYANNIRLQDAYMLGNCKLDVFLKQYGESSVQKTDDWDYEKIRNQNTKLTYEEWEYACHDVLGACIAICNFLYVLSNNRWIPLDDAPNTSTGIVRKESMKWMTDPEYYKKQIADVEWDYKKVGDGCTKKDAKKRFVDVSPESYYRMNQLECVYNGGYTHANKHILWETQEDVVAYDFASSYPARMMTEKFPVNKFKSTEKEYSVDEFLTEFPVDKDYAYGLVAFENLRLKDPNCPYPYAQVSKIICEHKLEKTIISSGKLVDNGRIISMPKCKMRLSNLKLDLIARYYTWDRSLVWDIQYSRDMDYLPIEFRNYIWSLWIAKCKLKPKEKESAYYSSLYKLSKSKLNSLYGMCVQKSIKDEVVLDYTTGEFSISAYAEDIETEYKKQYLQLNDNDEVRGGNNPRVLPYVWGVLITEYAQRSLFDLIELVDNPVKNYAYCDTDSVYAKYGSISDEKLEQYNNKCKQKLIDSGYGAVVVDGEELWLGIAELDGCYSGATFGHSKCYIKMYAGSDSVMYQHPTLRKKIDGYIKKKLDGTYEITVAGVPKDTGSKLVTFNTFTPEFVFKGELTGKKTSIYMKPKTDDDGNIRYIWKDSNGNSVSTGICLIPCDYVIGEAHIDRLDDIDFFEFEDING